ncbi:MAG: phospholipase D family protein [Microthrixaceae bacterium]
MLQPTNRLMLVDALRPPAGFTLDTAVGTTFTLHLDALLLATMSFAMFDHLDSDDGAPDPIALLESVRRHADSITVFAQAGALSGPRKHPPILAYLESSVVPVRPPKPGHLFHPKVWALRFVDETAQVRYRLVVLSRNLTLDTSWDTIVQLDGQASENAPDYVGVVGDFIAGLPDLAAQTLDPERRGAVERLGAELRSVRWENPPGVRWLRFHPLGPGFGSPTITGERVLVVSPFLTDGMTRKLGDIPGPNVLVSRPAALDGVGAEAVSGFEQAYVLDAGEPPAPPLVNPSDVPTHVSDGERDESLDDVGDYEIEPPRPGVELSGLHAKVFLTEGSDYTRLWLGSANATDAAFGGNSEFAVELAFQRESLSIDGLLDDGDPTSLRSLLSEYQPASELPCEPTPLEVATRKLDSVLRDLAVANYTVAVSPEGSQFRLELGWDPPSEKLIQRIVEGALTVTIGPATPLNVVVPLADGGAVIPSVSLQAVTSFLVIEATATVDGVPISGRTLVNAKMSGAPDDRHDQVLASLLDDPDKVLRYLLFLLAELAGDESLLDALKGAGLSFDWSNGLGQPPLLETMLRALVDSPASLDPVGDLVDSFQASQKLHLLPAGFVDVAGDRIRPK